MSSSTNVPPNSAPLPREAWLRAFMDKVSLKEDGSNFIDWEANLRNAAIADGKLRYLVDPPPPTPTTRSTNVTRDAYNDYMMESSALKNVLIYAMAPSLQRRMINLNAHQIFTRLTTMFSQAPRIVKYEAAVKFFEARLGKGQSVSTHVLKMVEYVETMERLGSVISNEIAVDRILHSLGDSFAQFRVNYNMQNMDKSLHELHSLLVQAEKDMKMSGSVSTKGDVLMVNKKGKGISKGKKKRGKSGKAASKDKGKAVETAKPKSKKGASSDEPCFYCSNVGHWKRNCPKYLEDKKSGMVPAGAEKRASTS